MDKPSPPRKALPCVMIESPFAGNILHNTRYARDAVRHSLSLGEAPFAMHLFYPEYLRDKVPTERALGIASGLAWLAKADLVAFYTDHGMSPGMDEARAFCLAHNIPYTLRNIPQGA